MHFLYRLTSTVLLSIALAGCILTSKYPLSSETEGIVDENVLGDWYGNTPYGEHLVVARNGRNGIAVSFFERDKLSFKFDGHITSLGNTKVVNLKTPPSSPSKDVTKLTDAECPYWLFPYEIENGVLNVRAIPSEAWAEAIAAGTISGKVVTSDRNKIRLIDTPDRLREFLAKHPSADDAVLVLRREAPRKHKN